MTIEEIKEAKKLFENKIDDMVADFKKETGTTVEEIHLFYYEGILSVTIKVVIQ